MKSCKEINQLVASGKKLSFLEKFALKFHFSICKVCTVYKKQQEAITEVIRKRNIEKQKSIVSTSQKVEENVLNNLKKKS